MNELLEELRKVKYRLVDIEIEMEYVDLSTRRPHYIPTEEEIQRIAAFIHEMEQLEERLDYLNNQIENQRRE